MAELNDTNNAISNKRGRSRKIPPKVDLTAMVDLAFLLITFFMLTTSLNKPNSLDVVVPYKNLHAQVDLIVQDNSYTLIHGDIRNPIQTVNNITATNKSLKAKLNEISQSVYTLINGKKAVVLIKPTTEANTKSIVDSFDEIRSAGIKHYMLSKLSKEDEQLVSVMRY
jgi:biopolymer transport protein ExbD